MQEGEEGMEQLPRATLVGWVERSETQQTHQTARLSPSCKVLGFATLYSTYRLFGTAKPAPTDNDLTQKIREKTILPVY